MKEGIFLLANQDIWNSWATFLTSQPSQEWKMNHKLHIAYIIICWNPYFDTKKVTNFIPLYSPSSPAFYKVDWNFRSFPIWKDVVILCLAWIFEHDDSLYLKIMVTRLLEKFSCLCYNSLWFLKFFPFVKPL